MNREPCRPHLFFKNAVPQSTTPTHPATLLTRDELRTIAHSQLVRQLSSLSLPEVDEAVEQIAQHTPAGNVPAMVLNGLLRIPERHLSSQHIKRDVNLLLQGVRQTLVDVATYTTFFAGPAAALYAFQGILKLAGFSPESAFPNGTWQFYVDYALRDDLARHANETDGFDTTLRQHQLTLSAVDRLTAWTMAAIYTLHQYDELLANEWRERTYTRLLREVAEALAVPPTAAVRDAYRRWEKLRPYGRGVDVNPTADYPTYRRQKFEAFMAEAVASLPPEGQQRWREAIGRAEQAELGNYQAQMTILATLQPDTYAETHVPLAIENAHIGLIYRQQYYLIPVCQQGTRHPTHVQTVRSLIASILARPTHQPPANLVPLAEVRRTAVPETIHKLPKAWQEALAQLRTAPILLNGDQRPPHDSLAQIRRGERGIGDHALTIFDTGQSFVLDQSHIFFDGAWGAALAEIMTNEALAWAAYLHTLPSAVPTHQPTAALPLHGLETSRTGPKVTAETSAESAEIDLNSLLRLRQLFKQRSHKIQLTVNDLLVLYRAIHAVQYRPAPVLVAELEGLKRQGSGAAELALAAVSQATPPAVLIPVDASQLSPRDRLYPMTFEVPLGELELLETHQHALSALEAGDMELAKAWRRKYLTILAWFGAVFSQAKQAGIEGKSDSVQTMKLLANLPRPLQTMLTAIPDRFDVLNDLIKGREVFSNVGAVVPSSSLRRFITAKDDNDKKTLCWGVMTDADGVMFISLRDFRPHVAALCAENHAPLAQRLTQDYLATYVHGLNTYIREVKKLVS